MLTAVWIAVSGFLSKLPWWVWAALATVLAFWYWGHHQFNAGVESTKREFAAVQAGVVTLQTQITTQIETEYVDRVHTVYETGKTIIKEVPVFIPADSVIGGGWRVLYDSAVQGVIPDPAAIADASPVPLRDAATTAVSNLTTCRAEIVKLEGLQQWIRQQQELLPNG